MNITPKCWVWGAASENYLVKNKRRNEDHWNNQLRNYLEKERFRKHEPHWPRLLTIPGIISKPCFRWSRERQPGSLRGITQSTPLVKDFEPFFYVACWSPGPNHHSLTRRTAYGTAIGTWSKQRKLFRFRSCYKDETIVSVITAL